MFAFRRLVVAMAMAIIPYSLFPIPQPILFCLFWGVGLAPPCQPHIRHCSVFSRTLPIAALHFVRVPPPCSGYRYYSLPHNPYSSVFFGVWGNPTILAYVPSPRKFAAYKNLVNLFNGSKFWNGKFGIKGVGGASSSVRFFLLWCINST